MFKGSPLPVLRATLVVVLVLLSICFLLLVINKASQAANLNQPSALLITTLTVTDAVTLTTGAELDGVVGPSAVNCSDPAYVTARALLDQQREAWVKAAMALLPGTTAMKSLLAGPSGTSITAPLLLTQPDGFQITMTPVDLAPIWGFQSGATTPGVPAFDNVQINGSPSGCTMQDNAPRPSSAIGGDYYFNQLNNAHGLNGILFTFSTPVQAFGAFFGDVETSYRGTRAFLRLLDASGNLVADLPISSTLGLTGGVAAENAVCDQRKMPAAQVAAQGLASGCGNGSTRWIGFVAATPIAQALVVVGDNDSLPGGRGLTEKLSVMGPTVMRALPPAEVTIGKSAPTQVTAGIPFYDTIVVSNTSDSVAAGVVLTDSAPTGITFDSVSGADCTFVATVVTCHLDTLAAGASTTIRVQATANGTTPVTNTAVVTATNDSDPANNTATLTVTPLAALPRNDCAVPLSPGGPPLVINEILYRQESATTDEWVELWSTTVIPGGTQFYLSDNEAGIAEFGLVFTIPAGGIPADAYLVIHRIAGADDLDAVDGVLQFYNAGGGGVKLNDSGDNITLYLGASADGIVLDYVAYGSSSAVDAGPDWAEPNAPVGAVNGQSIAALFNGANTNSGTAWTLSGTHGTRGPASPGATNNPLVPCNVAITKTGPTAAVVGVPFDYLLTVKNTTAITLTGVVITDTQPTGMLFNGVTGTGGCNLAGNGFTCTVGALLPNASAMITVNTTAILSGVITNTAYAMALSDTMPSDNQASHAIAFQSFGAIGDFIYLDVNHNGVQDVTEQQPLDGVPVTLYYPDGTITTTVSIDGLYLFPHLPPATYTVTVGTAPGYERTSVATYKITLAVDQIEAQADFGFVYAPAALRVTKAGAPTATVGDTLRYTLTVWNTSTTIPAIAVVLTDTLPSGLAHIQITDRRCGVIDTFLLCNFGRLAPQATDTIVVTTTAAVAGSWPNAVVVAADNNADTLDNRATLTTVILVPTPIATVTSTPTSTLIPTATPTPTNTPTVTATPLPLADLVLVKSAPFTVAAPGDLITYTLAYSNVGAVAASLVTITETVPTYTTFIPSHSTPGWVCPGGSHAGASCYFPISRIAPQQGGVLHYVVQVDTTLPHSFYP